MTYNEAIQFLYELRLFGAKFGLDNTRKLAALAGNPQKRLRFIHVAGTNGKGSTCAMLESVYRASGLRVGLFTSPHLVAFGERIQINREPIPEAEVVRLVEELQPLFGGFPAAAHPTFFEVVTVMALLYFARHGCELVVWETGLGGRLDATNIVTPLASVITNIGLEHTQWLGETHERIAAEKAGIIKPGVPVVTGATPGHGLEIIVRTAEEQGSPISVVTERDATRPPLDDLGLPLRGGHQKLNAAVALETLHVLSERIPVTEAHIRQGLEHVVWAGRLQLVQGPTGQTMVLDAAHNADGTQALATALEQQFGGRRPVLIFGVMADKDWKAMLTRLVPLAKRMLLAPVKSSRTLPVADQLALCRQSFPDVDVAGYDSLSEALRATACEDLVVVTGSVYLVGEALELLHLSAVPNADEKGLNEWTAPAVTSMER
jgi:dihydrofolate synthase/folylpolyglutamate synthase